MAKRIIIGLWFTYNENWIGGSYYILNLIQSLLLLEDKDKPHLVILLEKEEDQKQVEEIKYPYITYRILDKKLPFFSKLINKITQTNLFKIIPDQLDCIFPSQIKGKFNWVKKKLFWIPDFQELHLPEFFPEHDLEKRKEQREYFSITKNTLVLSSHDALNDYKHFFPKNNTNNFVLNFSVFHPYFGDLNEEIFDKYDLNGIYFFSPNQFWKHKNHLVILKALLTLKGKNNLNFKVAFSGKEFDYRNQNYINEIKTFVVENQLQDHVKFLGFIDRKEQLYLMKHAKAIIQPSLFEGWSTVVEDAKRLNQNCIVSNLRVHQEQLGETGHYFDPQDYEKLAALLLNFSSQNIEKPNYFYEEKAKQFGINFMKIIKSI